MDNSELQQHNPWWIRPDFIEEDPRIMAIGRQRYVFLPELLVRFPPGTNGVLTIRGPRQVGKTTLVKLMIKKLLTELNAQPLTVFFFSCDRISHYDDLYRIIKSFLDYARPRTKGRLFCFIDEISFVGEWQRAVKSLADMGMINNTTLVLTGSNAVDIKTSSERLPGRRGDIFRPDWELLPLDFTQFLHVVAPEIATLNYSEAHLKFWPEIKKFFEDYLLCGGFLSAINKFYMEGGIPPYIYELYWNWIEGDLHRMKRSPETALSMIEKIFSATCSTTSFYKLARDSGMASHVTAGEYVDTLKRMYVLNVLDCFILEQRRRDPKKNKKIYIADPFILTTLLSVSRGFLDDAFGYSKKNLILEDIRPKIAQMCVNLALARRFTNIHYGLGADFEIDFVAISKGMRSFFEVKYRESFNSKIYSDYAPCFITKELFNEATRSFPLELFLGYIDQIANI